jgi:hypothetical protein
MKAVDLVKDYGKFRALKGISRASWHIRPNSHGGTLP